MDIDFKTNKLAKICNNYKLAQKEYGDDCARKLMQRLQEFLAAPNLSTISHLPPPRLHNIGGNKFAVDVKQPYRLLIEIDDKPIPLDVNGGIDKSNVYKIKVVSVEDYHGK